MSAGSRISLAASSALTPRRSGISARTVALRIVPNAASPIDPPSVRKNMIVAVATPRSWNSTAFWVAIDVVVNTAAMPKPMAIIGATSQAYGVVPVMWLMANSPPAATRRPDDRERLVATGPQDHPADAERPEGDADHLRQHAQAGLGRRHEQRVLEVEREELAGAEGDRAGARAGDDARQHDRIGEQVQRDHRLGGPPLDDDEHGQPDGADGEEGDDVRLRPAVTSAAHLQPDHQRADRQRSSSAPATSRRALRRGNGRRGRSS